MTVLVTGATGSIGREVVAALLARHLSGPKLADFRRSYRFIARFHLRTAARDVAATTALLGRAPRRYETYVRDTAGRWGDTICTRTDAEGKRWKLVERRCS